MVKQKHIEARIKQCLVLASLSNCPRRKFGALLLDPMRNVVVSEGYNGGPRGGGELCEGDTCLRDTQNVVSGTQIEVGCHHAEMNAITNAAARGIAIDGTWLIINGEPCMMCAKLLHHSGISKVIVVSGGFMGANGLDYLREHGVGVEFVDGPKDPRLKKLSEE